MTNKDQPRKLKQQLNVRKNVNNRLGVAVIFGVLFGVLSASFSTTVATIYLVIFPQNVSALGIIAMSSILAFSIGVILGTYLELRS